MDNSETLMTLGQVAEWIGARLEGEPSRQIRRLAPLDQAGADDLTFADAANLRRLGQSHAQAAIVPQDARLERSLSLLRVDDVQLAVATLLGRLASPEDRPPVGVHPHASVDPSVRLGEAVAIGARVTIGADVTIGDRTVILAGVSIGRGSRIGAGCVLGEGAVIRHECVLGDRVRVGPNSVIGYDGFGYLFRDGAHHWVPHAGNVVVEDDVELGACVCIDRAKFASTRIGAGSKLDNLVQIGHNCRLGRGVIVAGMAGIAGSVEVGDYVIVGGGAAIRDNVRIGAGAKIAARSAVAGDIEAGASVAGMPARDGLQHLRMLRNTEKIPQMQERLRDLEARLKALESPEDHRT